MAERPDMDCLPYLEYGEGFWGYDSTRRKITLRFRCQGREHIVRGEDADECLVKRRRKLRDLETLSSIEGDGSVGTMFAKWIEANEGRDEGTLYNYRWSVAHYLLHLDPGMNTWDLTVEMVEEMWLAVIASGLAKRTVSKLRGNWAMVLDFGARRNLMPRPLRDELRLAKLPTMSSKATRHSWFGLEDYESIRAFLLKRQEARDVLLMMILLCGLRPAEAVGLKWEYVDLDNRILRVEGQIKRRSKMWTPVLKTDHEHLCAHREVPIPADLTLVLRSMLTESTSEFVFIDDKGPGAGQLIQFDAIRNHAVSVASSARLGYVHPHGYRHTYASVCLHNGMQPEQLAKLMGHVNTKQITETYAHAISKPNADDMDRYLSTETSDEGDDEGDSVAA